MNDCPKLWLKHYEHQPSTTRPPFVEKYLRARASNATNYNSHGPRGASKQDIAHDSSTTHVASLDSTEKTFDCSEYEDAYGVVAMTEETHFYDQDDPTSVGGTSLMVVEPPPEPHLDSSIEMLASTRIDIPNHLIYMNKGQGRYIVDVVVDPHRFRSGGDGNFQRLLHSK